MKRTVSGALVATALIAVTTLGVRADDENTFRLRATLSGNNETPLAISSIGQGRLRATLDTEAQTITFDLTYSDLVGGDPPLFAHIHFGKTGVSGGVMVFFCGGGGKPACPATNGGSVTVSGTITADDVVGPSAQNINAGEFGKVVDAILSGTSYANIHTTKYPGGEIRGQVKVRGKED